MPTPPRPRERSGTREEEPALSRKHIRGSSLLLAGRVTSMLIKFVAQVIIVRYLATADYGAWTYAVAAALFFRGFATLGLNKSLPRFLSIYLEREQYDRFFGTFVLILGTLLAASGLVVAAFYAFPQELASWAGQEGPEAVTLLFIVIFLVPLDALDDFLTGVCATFSKSRVLFMRRYVINPGLLLAVGVGLVLFRADVLFLAYGYVIASLIGVLYYAWSAFQIMRQAGLFPHLQGGVVLPVRELAGYTAPLMVADWAGTLIVSLGPLMLGYYTSLDAVAIYQVIVPLVAVAEVVQRTFAILFKPTASRLFAREDRAGLDALYWRTATWTTVLGFPTFALTFTLAHPLTVLFFGDRYAPAAPILSVLVLAYYLGSTLGPSSSTVKIVGKMGWVVAINLSVALLTLGLHRLLVPSFGPLGAGVATALTLGLYAVLNHVALWFAAGVRPFDTQYAGPYIVMGISVLVLVGVRILMPEGVVVPALATILATIAVTSAARRQLRFSDTFPEVGRFRIARALLG